MQGWLGSSESISGCIRNESVHIPGHQQSRQGEDGIGDQDDEQQHTDLNLNRIGMYLKEKCEDVGPRWVDQRKGLKSPREFPSTTHSHGQTAGIELQKRISLN